MIRGKRGITAETALLLSAYFRNSAEFWMQLQAAHDLAKARQELRPKQPVHNAKTRGKVARTA